MALNTAKALAYIRDLSATFHFTYESAKPFYPTICTTVLSVGADERYAWLASFPGVREWLGERLYHELRAADFELRNKDWESSLLVAKNDIKDDRMGMYSGLMQGLANEAAYHPDKLLFQLIVNGETLNGFDNVPFFSGSHIWGDSGQQNNSLTSPVTDLSRVTATEVREAIYKGIDAIALFKNDRGEPMSRVTIEEQSDIVVLVPPGLRRVAHEAFEAQLVGGGNSNVILDKPRIVATPMLPNSAKIYVLKTGEQLKPFVFQDREKLSFGDKGFDDREFKDIKFMTEARYNVGYLAWWNACLVTLSPTPPELGE